MNLLDRLIATFAPSAGLRRAVARQAISTINRPRNLYEAARSRRSLENWLTTGASADAEIGGQIQVMRNRARDLGRNSPFISRAYDLLAAEMVGKGVRPRLAENVPQQIRQRTMDAWNQWVNEADPEGMTDLYGIQLLAARTVVESGEALLRFDPAPGRRIPWTVRVLEPEYVDYSRHLNLENGNAIRLGVEYNQSGNRVAYWMWTEHPGSDLFMRNLPGIGVERIPADRIAPIYYKSRPEQTHGVPWISPISNTIRLLDDVNDARLNRAIVQAYFAAFITSTPEAGAITTEVDTGRRRQKLAPGIIEYLLPEESVQLAQPPQSEGDDAWQILLLHHVAAGLGLTYAQLTGDLRQVNYSSMRKGMLDFWKLLDTWQNAMLGPMCMRRLWQVFDTNEAVRQRRIGSLSVDWAWPSRALIDPLKDGQAIDAALLAGRMTFHEAIAADGRDPEAHIAELRQEHDELGDLNLPYLTQAAPPPAVATQDQPMNGADQQNGQGAMQ